MQEAERQRGGVVREIHRKHGVFHIENHDLALSIGAGRELLLGLGGTTGPTVGITIMYAAFSLIEI